MDQNAKSTSRLKLLSALPFGGSSEVFSISNLEGDQHELRVRGWVARFFSARVLQVYDSKGALIGKLGFDSDIGVTVRRRRVKFDFSITITGDRPERVKVKYIDKYGTVPKEIDCPVQLIGRLQINKLCFDLSHDLLEYDVIFKNDSGATDFGFVVGPDRDHASIMKASDHISGEVQVQIASPIDTPRFYAELPNTKKAVFENNGTAVDTTGARLNLTDIWFDPAQNGAMISGVQEIGEVSAQFQYHCQEPEMFTTFPSPIFETFGDQGVSSVSISDDRTFIALFNQRSGRLLGIGATFKKNVGKPYAVDQNATFPVESWVASMQLPKADDLPESAISLTSTRMSRAPHILKFGKSGKTQGMSQAEQSDVVFEMAKHIAPADGMTILFVFPGSLLEAGGGGQRRAMELIEFLSKSGYRIILLDQSDFGTISAQETRYLELRQFIDGHIPVGRKFTRHLANRIVADCRRGEHEDKLLNALIDRLDQKPPKLAKLGSRDLIARRENLHFNLIAAYFSHAMAADVFLTSFIWTSSAFDFVRPGSVKILDAVDIQSERYRSFQEAAKQHGKDIIPDIKTYFLSPDVEQNALQKADVVLAISPKEQTVLNEMIGPEKVVRAGFGISEAKALPHKAASKRILFVGNRYMPNILAAKSLIDIVFPKLLSLCPEAELHICGSVSHAIDSDQISSANVFVKGFVDDLTAEYEAAAVIVNPVEYGSGLSIKAAEAVAHGRVCIVSPYVAQSFVASVDQGVMIAAELGDMHEQIAQLLKDPDARAKLEAKAYQFATAELSNDVVLADLLNMLETKLFY